MVNDQRDAQILFYVFIFILTLYMFRAHRAHHHERQIVSIQPLVPVGGRVVCRSEAVVYPGIFFRGGLTNSVEDRGQRERGSGGAVAP